jgi:hypothetical protein
MNTLSKLCGIIVILLLAFVIGIVINANTGIRPALPILGSNIKYLDSDWSIRIDERKDNWTRYMIAGEWKNTGRWLITCIDDSVVHISKFYR